MFRFTIQFGGVACLVSCFSCLPSVQAEDTAYDNSQPHWLASERLSGILAREPDLAKLTMSADSVVATHAVWRRIENRLARSKGQPSDDSPAETKPEYFLGFLEGRLRLNCPEWWRTAITTVQARDDGTVVFDVEGDKRKPDYIRGLAVPAGATAVLLANGDWEVKVRDQTLRIPKKAAADGMANSAASAFEVAIEKDLRCVGWCGGHGNVYVMRITDDGEQWSAMAAGLWDVGAFSGPGYKARVQLVLIDDAIAVFAADSSVVYVEVFATATGKRQFRFSSGANYVK